MNWSCIILCIIFHWHPAWTNKILSLDPNSKHQRKKKIYFKILFIFTNAGDCPIVKQMKSKQQIKTGVYYELAKFESATFIFGHSFGDRKLQKVLFATVDTSDRYIYQNSKINQNFTQLKCYLLTFLSLKFLHWNSHFYLEFPFQETSWKTGLWTYFYLFHICAIHIMYP